MSLLLILAALAIADTPPGPAPPPENAVEFNEHYYLLVDEVEDLSWTLARDACAADGAHLAVVTSKEEAEFIAGLCADRYMFLGASDHDEEGTWVWVDGAAWTFTHWMKGQPNDYSGSEDYLATYDGGEWVDVGHGGRDFWMPTGYICEWDRPRSTE